jgi:3'(2'), 5'-bisphosphate nucleotidase
LTAVRTPAQATTPAASPSESLDFAIAAVRQAAEACRQVRSAFRPELAASKADHSPVTVADYASQAIISLALAELLPGDPIIGEESASDLRSPDDAARAQQVVDLVRLFRPDAALEEVCWAIDRCDDGGGPEGRHWTLDPVDGTKGFLRNQQYAVALALIEDGEVVLGVLGCPNLPQSLPRSGDAVPTATDGGSLFAAQRGRGAFQMPLGADGWDGARQIRVSDVTSFAGGRFSESFESGHSSQSAGAAIAEALGITEEPLRMDSQAKYAVVARGDAELYFRLPSSGYIEQIWDHAAGAVIVEEAGGRVSDISGRPLDFSAGRRLERNRGLLVAPAALHAQVVAAARGLEG